MGMKRALLTACLILWGPSWAAAQELKVKNDYGERVHLWQWVPSYWIEPTLFLQKNGTGRLDLSHAGESYYTLIDSRHRERTIGWIDLHPVYQIDVNAVIGIRQLFYSESRAREGWRRVNGRLEWGLIEETVKVPVAKVYIYSGGKAYEVDDFIRRFRGT